MEQLPFSVIVPCFDEEYRDVAKTLAFMDGYFGFRPEYLIMENGSFKLENLQAYCRYFHRIERGLGWALREGIRNASRPFVFFLPADLSYDLSFVQQALAYLHTGYDLVIGSKALPDSIVLRPFKREVLSTLYNLALKLRYGPSWPSDITGVKAYKRESILPLLRDCPSDGVFFEVELMKALRGQPLRCKEIGVIVNDSRPSHFMRLQKKAH